MLAAASDSTTPDRVAAAMVFATADAAGLSIAGYVRAGHVKADAVVPSVFARIPGAAGLRAFYVPVAQEKTGLKGDTIYLPTTFDITDLADRSLLVHELTHAQDDRSAAGGIHLNPTDQLEVDAYRAQGRYLLK